MRITYLSLLWLITSGLLPQGLQPARESVQPLPDKQAIYQELMSKLPQASAHVQSAKPELEYYGGDIDFPSRRATRHSVRTITGHQAEVILLVSPSPSWPGYNFSMAFLLVDGHPIDWVSCWTYFPSPLPHLKLQDVDGDGQVDVAFRYDQAISGDMDGHKTWSRDKHILYAYRITDRGFQSIFPPSEREVSVQSQYETHHQPVRFEIVGLPSSMRENKLYELIARATNLSKDTIPIKYGEWLQLDGYGCLIYYPAQPMQEHIQPGQTVSCRIWLRIVLRDAPKNSLKLLWSFLSSHTGTK